MRFIEDKKKQKAKAQSVFLRIFVCFIMAWMDQGVRVDIFRYRLAGPRVGVDPG